MASYPFIGVMSLLAIFRDEICVKDSACLIPLLTNVLFRNKITP
jgi:hypothetical protein